MSERNESGQMMAGSTKESASLLYSLSFPIPISLPQYIWTSRLLVGKFSFIPERRTISAKEPVWTFKKIHFFIFFSEISI